MSVWTDKPRYTSRQVLWGSGLTDITRYVTGDIVVRREAGNLAMTCEMPVSTELLAYFATGSLSAPAALQVIVTCTSSSGTDTVTLFHGRCEAPKNTGIIRMRGSLSGAFGALSELSGCLLVAAMTEYSRVELLATFATAANAVYGSLDTSRLDSSRVPLKPIDLQGITTADLIERWRGGVDGWEARINASGIELVPLDDIVGPTVTPLYTFAASSYYECAEQAPSRPVTQYVLSGQYLTVKDGDVVEEETDETGTTTTTTTWTDGVITLIVKEREEDYAPHGVEEQESEEQVVWRITTTITYNQTSGYNTAQMATRTTVTEKFYSAYAADDSYYQWRDGTYRVDEVETLMEVERVEETFEWDVLKCFVKTYESYRYGWLAPLSEVADDGNFGDPQVLWSTEGKYRAIDAEEYIVTEHRLVREDFFPVSGSVLLSLGDGRVFSDAHSGRFRARLEMIYRWGVKSGAEWIYPRLSVLRTTTWKETKDGQRHEQKTVDYRTTLHKYYAASPEVLVGDAEFNVPADIKTRIVNEPVPHPETKSPTQRAFYLTPFTTTYTASSSFDVVEKSYFSELFEDPGEAYRTARWEARRNLADTFTISHPGDPNMLEWDPVTVTDVYRNISTAKPGWIDAIEWRLGTASLMQTTTVKLDPLPADDPMDTA